jgi:Ankyrin repeats (many copies)
LFVFDKAYFQCVNLSSTSGFPRRFGPSAETRSGKPWCDASDQDLIKLCNDSIPIIDVTALHCCAENGRANVCEYLSNLVESGGREGSSRKRIVDVDKVNWSQRTALFEACGSGHLQVTRLLLEAGANVNRKDYLNWTPLHVAARHGRNEIVNLLLVWRPKFKAETNSL